MLRCVLLFVSAFVISCGTDAGGATSAMALPDAGLVADSGSDRLPSLRSVPVAPAAATSGSWAGVDDTAWGSAAVLANAAGTALNWAWHEQSADVLDAVVAFPVRLSDSNVGTLNDGITHAGLELGNWPGLRMPVSAILVRFADGSSRIRIVIDREIVLLEETIEVHLDGTEPQTVLVTTNDQGHNIADVLDVNAVTEAPLRIRIPGLPSGEWFVVTFEHQMVPLEPLLESIPSGFRRSDSGWALPDPMSALTGEGLAIESLTSGVGGAYPQTARTEAGLYGLHPLVGVSAVGDTLVWGADIPDVPMKHRYECISARNRGAEVTEGAPSGLGWHTVRYRAKAIVNSLESRPMLMALGHTQVLSPPELEDGLHAYGLWDVAVFRWLHPGEAAVSIEPMLGEANGVSFERTQHSWLLADDEETARCYETWFYPCAPQTAELFNCPGVEVVFYATDAPAEPGDVVGIAGTIEELGGVSTGDSQWDGSGALEMPFDPALDKWAASVLLPPGTSASFALFVRRKDGTVIWERGERVLETTGVDGELYQMQWFE